MPFYIQTDSDESLIEAIGVAQQQEVLVSPMGDEEAQREIVREIVEKFSPDHQKAADEVVDGLVETYREGYKEGYEEGLALARSSLEAARTAVNDLETEGSLQLNGSKLADILAAKRNQEPVSIGDKIRDDFSSHFENEGVFRGDNPEVIALSMVAKQAVINTMANFNSNIPFDGMTPHQQLQAASAASSLTATMCFAVIGHPIAD